MIWIFSVFSAELGSIADTCTASVYGAFEEAHIFCWSPHSVLSLVRQRIHALCQSTELFGYGCFAGSVPMMRCITSGMDQEYSYVGVAWLETVEIPQLQFIAGR